MNTMDFAALAALQRDIDELLKCQVASLQHYHLTNGGFRHKYIEDPPKPSKASAATCIASLANSSNMLLLGYIILNFLPELTILPVR